MTQLKFDVVRKVNSIKRCLRQLEKNYDASLASYRNDFDWQMIVERLLHIIIGSAIDINVHLVVSREQPLPETYGDSFATVGKIGAISTELARELVPSSDLMNRLVQGCDNVDLEVIQDAIGFTLTLYPKYLAQIEQYIQCLDE